jgi:hypothetical protein
LPVFCALQKLKRWGGVKIDEKRPHSSTRIVAALCWPKQCNFQFGRLLFSLPGMASRFL